MCLLTQPVAQNIDSFSGFCRNGENFQIGVTSVGIPFDSVHIEVEIRQNVDLVDDQRVANLEYKGILKRLVVPFGNGEDHDVFYCTCVELGRAHKVPHVFENDKVQILVS